MAEEIKVTFNERESWQSLDCLYCGEQATLQAEARKGSASAAIRCCSNPECKQQASVSAMDCVERAALQLTKQHH